MKSYKFILAVQGEGRGHLTQAIAVFELLKRSGHTVSCVTVGMSGERRIPDFFIRKINVPIIRMVSPNFVKDKQNRSISMPRTVAANLLNLGVFRKSLNTLKQIIEDYSPDVVINFYEPLIGWYAIRYKATFKILSIAHQYTYLHNNYRFPKGHSINSFLTRLYTRFTAAGSAKILALSIRDLPDPGNKQLIVIPPVLRKELFQQDVRQENFILVYVLNSGYIPDIIKWHREHPSVTLYCFTDSAEVKDEHKGEWKICETLIFYSLNDHKFLELMARCEGLVCNAGFESVCEAMYLGKPVMMVPVKGHFEQYCNAQDGVKYGAGIYSSEFNLGLMENYFLFHRKEDNGRYREWVDKSECMLLQAINSLFPLESAGPYGGRIQDVKQYYIDQLTEPSFSSFRDIPSS